MTQLNFLNGEDRKAMGLAVVEAEHPTFLSQMRDQAKKISASHGWVTIDQVRQYAEQRGLTPPHSRVWGAVFKGRGWQCTGEAPSRIPSNHAHRNKVWRWVGQ